MACAGRVSERDDTSASTEGPRASPGSARQPRGGGTRPVTHQQRLSSNEVREAARQAVRDSPRTTHEIARLVGLSDELLQHVLDGTEESTDYLFTRLLDVLTPFVLAPIADGFIAFRKPVR